MKRATLAILTVIGDKSIKLLHTFLIGLMTAFTAQNGAIKREAAIESSGLDINTEEQHEWFLGLERNTQN